MPFWSSGLDLSTRRLEAPLLEGTAERKSCSLGSLPHKLLVQRQPLMQPFSSLGPSRLEPGAEFRWRHQALRASLGKPLTQWHCWFSFFALFSFLRRPNGAVSLHVPVCLSAPLHLAGGWKLCWDFCLTHAGMTHEVELVADVKRDRLRLPLHSANVKTYLR